MNKKYAGLDFPAWFDGKDINEAAFCREFLSKNKLIYADNAFFTSDGRLTDPLLLKEKIYAELECCAAKNIPRTISNIVEIMKLRLTRRAFHQSKMKFMCRTGRSASMAAFLRGGLRSCAAGFLLPTIRRRESRLSGCGFFPTYFTRRTFQPFRSISAIASFPAPKGSA